MTEQPEHSTKPKETSFGWERLITEGHVRAARLRSTRPYAISLGIALVVIGFYGFLYLSAPSPENSFNPERIVHTKAEEYRRPVHQKIAMMRFTRKFNGEEIAKVATPQELTHRVQNILTALHEKGELLDEGFRTLEAKEFWDSPWPQDDPVTTAFVVNKGDLIAIGAYVNDGDEENPDLKPWIGLFKKQTDKAWGMLNFIFPENKGQWLFASLNDGSFYTLPDKPSATPRDIVVSLRALMDMED